MQVCINVLLFLDAGIENVSLMYLNLVWLLLTLSFLSFIFIRDKRRFQGISDYNKDYFETLKGVYEEQLEHRENALKDMRLSLLEKQDELLAWVHEMKSPLTVLQLIQDKIQPPAVREQVEAEWLRLYLLLDQQLYATRLITIEQDSRMQNVKLSDVIIQEVKDLRSWCFEKNIAVELDEVDVEVITDAKWLAFIVRQVLTNAVKYSHRGGEIRIYTTMQEDQYTLHIADDGIGISKEDLPRVFRKSYTGTVGRETSAASGMGLYLAKQAADMINVTLTIDSKEQQGTTVHIAFSKDNTYTETLRT